MYYRRYSGVDSRDAARRGAVPRCSAIIPVLGRNYDPGFVVKRVRGLQLAATAIPTDQFCRGTAPDFLFLPLVDTNSRQEASQIRSQSVANFKQLIQLVEPWHGTANPLIDRCSCYKDLNGTSDAGRCDPFILLCRPYLYFYVFLLFMSTLSISVDSRQARYFVRTVVFITQENDVQDIGDRLEKPPKSTTTSWMDVRPTRRREKSLSRYWTQP